MVATAEVEALKATDVAPAGIVVVAGTVAAALLLEREATAPPAGAEPESVTVQVLGVPPVTAAGAH